MAEIGAGTGRFVRILVLAGATKVVAVEPSDAFEVLKANTQAERDRIVYLKRPAIDCRRRAISTTCSPSASCTTFLTRRPLSRRRFARSALAARLRSGCTAAKAIRAYLAVAGSLWWLTRRLPHRGLDLFVKALYPAFWVYMHACRWLPLPLAAYMQRVMLPLTPAKRRVVIYDQLNPAYAKYYTRAEAEALMTQRRLRGRPAAPSARLQLDRHRPQARRHEASRLDCRAGLQRGGDARRVRLAPRTGDRRCSKPATTSSSSW